MVIRNGELKWTIPLLQRLCEPNHPGKGQRIKKSINR